MIHELFGRKNNKTEAAADNTTRILMEAGWHEGREIDITGLLAECEENGICLTDIQKRFISEFGGISYYDKKHPSEHLFISDKRRAPHGDEDLYYVDITGYSYVSDELDEGVIYELVEKYGRNTVCVGCCFYYAYPLLLAENGTMLYVNGDYNELGATPKEALEHIVKGWGEHR